MCNTFIKKLQKNKNNIFLIKNNNNYTRGVHVNVELVKIDLGAKTVKETVLKGLDCILFC